MARRMKRAKPGRAKVKRAGLAARKRSRYLEGVTTIDITDYDFLRKFTTDHGKVIPARLSGATAKQQRRIKRGVRRARVIGLVP